MVRRTRGQGTIEYAILVMILVGALLAMQQYIKRGFQGRWKSSVDDIGEQYDPAAVNSNINYSLRSQANSTVTTMPFRDTVTNQDGFVTNRVDITNSVETKQGYTTVDAP